MIPFRAPIAALMLATSGPSAAQELVMFDQIGCYWCARWDAEIGPIYPKTDEGRRAPLRRMDIRAERPAEWQDLDRVSFTPTFVLMQDGREIGRIEGYPGEDFFWGLLGRMLGELPEPVPGTGPETTKSKERDS